MLAYLAVGVLLTVFWFHHHTQGPLELLWARTSRRPRPVPNHDASPPVEVIRNDGTASLLAVRPFAPGEVIVQLEGKPAARPTRFTIQVWLDAHLDPISDRVSPWKFMNHSCDPNLAIDVPRRVIVARRAIAAGDELCFNYNTTEWDMHEPCVCRCASSQCVGVVRGFAHLPPARQLALLSNASPHIRTLLTARALRRSRSERQSRLRMPFNEVKHSRREPSPSTG
jgi:hypothetical protein